MPNFPLTALTIVITALLLTQTASVSAQHGQDYTIEPQPVEDQPFSDIQNNWQGAGDDLRPHVREADLNNDGKISFEEHAAYFKKYFVQPGDDPRDWEDHLYDYYNFLDTDKNGQVSNHEYQNLFNAPPEPSEEI